MISIAIAGVTILQFFGVTSRYLLDITPLLSILSAVGIWQIYESSKKLPLRKIFHSILIILLITISITLSLSLTLTGKGANLDDQNPILFQRLADFFSR
jgi:hypothetical protein